MQRMNQAEYARHRKISPARVSKMIKTGKLPQSCYRVEGGKRLIDPVAADKALSENLDQIYNPVRNRVDPKLQKDQDQAADFAAELEPGKDPLSLPHVWWLLRYMVKLHELAADRFETVQTDKWEYTVTHSDIDENGEALKNRLRINIEHDEDKHGFDDQ